MLRATSDLQRHSLHKGAAGNHWSGHYANIDTTGYYFVADRAAPILMEGWPIVRTIRIDEVLTPELIATHSEHIRDFLTQEGIAADQHNLGATAMSERKIKELLEELAEE